MEFYFVARLKYAVPPTSEIKIVLEDGCELDEEEAFQCLNDNTNLFILTGNEQLNLPSTSAGIQHSHMDKVYEEMFQLHFSTNSKILKIL